MIKRMADINNKKKLIEFMERYIRDNNKKGYRREPILS